jgi:cytochrome c5
MHAHSVRHSAIVLAGLTLAFAATGCAAQAPVTSKAGETPDGATLVQQRCTRCHPSDRIDAARHDRAAWQATVDRMRGKGAVLDASEAATVVQYLSTR